MKTTLEIEGELLLAAKRAALDRRWTLRRLVEVALRKEMAAARAGKLKRLRRHVLDVPVGRCGSASATGNGCPLVLRPSPICREKIDWTVSPGGLPPGLDLASREKMWEWIESQPREPLPASSPRPKGCGRAAR